MENIVIAKHTVPGTDAVITLEWLRDAGRFQVSRTAGRKLSSGDHIVNYLCCTRTQIGEAKTAANALWTDTVARRDR